MRGKPWGGSWESRQ